MYKKIRQGFDYNCRLIKILVSVCVKPFQENQIDFAEYQIYPVFLEGVFLEKINVSFLII